MLRASVITLFPEMFQALTGSGITRRAHENGLWQLDFENPRDHAENAWRTVDDRPYGGGPGMLMQAGPIEKSVHAVRDRMAREGYKSTHVVYLSPQGRRLNDEVVQGLLTRVEGGEALALLCGRYEGVDERAIERCVDEEISLGDFVLSGGEIPAMALLDSVVRRLPGALNHQDSAQEDSFASGLLDCPHYTRPEVYENSKVPEVLLSGDHARIRRWRLQQALGRTWRRRPDLLAGRVLTKEETHLLAEYKQLCGQEKQE